MTEEWRTVPSVPRYEASSDGNIRHAVNGKNLRQVCAPKYPAVNIYNSARRRPAMQYVHRMVAEAFLGPCPAGKEVNHVDGNKMNAAISNLEYVTTAENARHAQRLGLREVKRPKRKPHERQLDKIEFLLGAAKLNETSVIEIRRRYDEGTSQRVLAEEHGVCTRTISMAISGDTWAHVPR